MADPTMLTITSIANALGAVASAVVAGVAVYIAYRSVKLSARALATQEAHNRLTLKPIPFLALADYEHLLRVRLMNDGAGPLVIRKLSVSDGKTAKEDVISWMPPTPKGIYWSNFTSLLTDRAIIPNNGLILLELKGDADKVTFSSFREKCRNALSKLTATVEYTNIYEEAFGPYQRSLDWFARDKGTRPQVAFSKLPEE